MIDRVAELNRVLLAVSSLLSQDGKARHDSVIQQCESTIIEGRMPKHELSVQFAGRIGLLRKEGYVLSITPEGRSFLELNPGSQYDLSPDQKRFILRTCYLHGPLRNDIFNLLHGFSLAYNKDTFRWSEVDGSPLAGESWMIDQLCQLGLLARGDGWLEVTPEYVNTVASFREEGRGWSEEKFRERLQEKLEVGNIAEELVKTFEVERLKKSGHVVESLSVRRISKLRVNAGYDIESFDGKCPNLNYDRFIEVKGAKGADLHFFWSDNEIRIAKILKEKYWIYFQGGVDLKNGVAKNAPLLFQNPIKTIMEDTNITTMAQGIIVEGKIKGKVLATS